MAAKRKLWTTEHNNKVLWTIVECALPNIINNASYSLRTMYKLLAISQYYVDVANVHGDE